MTAPKGKTSSAMAALVLQEFENDNNNQQNQNAKTPRKPPIPPRPQSSPEKQLSILIATSQTPEAIRQDAKRKQFNVDAAKFCSEALVR